MNTGCWPDCKVAFLTRSYGRGVSTGKLKAQKFHDAERYVGAADGAGAAAPYAARSFAAGGEEVIMSAQLKSSSKPKASMEKS